MHDVIGLAVFQRATMLAGWLPSRKLDMWADMSSVYWRLDNAEWSLDMEYVCGLSCRQIDIINELCTSRSDVVVFCYGGWPTWLWILHSIAVYSRPTPSLARTEGSIFGICAASFYRLDALPDVHPTALMHRRQRDLWATKVIRFRDV